MKRIVFCDVDGTLLNTEHRLTPLTRGAIRELEAADIPFVITSGRYPGAIRPFMREYGLSCPIIAYGGALALDRDGTILSRHSMPKTLAAEVIDHVEAAGYNLTWGVYAVNEWVVRDRGDKRVRREEDIVHATAVEGTVDTLTNAGVDKVLMMTEPGVIESVERDLRARFPTCAIIKSSPILLEVMAGGVSKSAAVRELCALWGTTPEDAIAFGDNYNDIDMLEAVGTGFLMGNAPQPLREQFPHLTDDCDHDGIYRALVRLGLCHA